MSDPRPIDRYLVRSFRARTARHGLPHFLAERVAVDIVERISDINRRFARMLEIATVPGAIVRPMLARDRVAEAIVGLVAPMAGRGLPSVQLDEEWLPFAPGSFDLVAAALTLHAANDLPGVLAQIARSLRADGLLIASFFGGATLSELRHAFAEAELSTMGGAGPRVMPFTDIREAGHLLQRAGLALPVADLDRVTVRYAGLPALFADLRAMGEGNALVTRSRRPLTRTLLARVAEAYAARFADPDGRLRATYYIVTITGWRAHESQQKPLAPGSARARLAGALGVAEQPAGEKANPPPRSGS